jgi:hypothetical protein
MIVILSFRERFSYADIAYVMDLSRNSVRTILTRLRTVILRHILENANYLKEEVNSKSAFRAGGAESDRDHKKVCLYLPFMFPQEVPSTSALDCWENEGGSLKVQLPGLRLCANSP